MNRINVFEPLRTQNLFQIFSTDAANAVPCHLFSALVDEQAVLIKRLGFDTVFGDIAGDKLNGFWFQFYLSIAVSFIALILYGFACRLPQLTGRFVPVRR